MVAPPVWRALTEVNPFFDPSRPSLKVTLGHSAILRTEPPAAAPAALELDIVLGPAFTVGNGWVVNALAAVSGQLTVGVEPREVRWRVVQWNVLNQSARTNYEPLTGAISLYLPLAFLDDEEGRQLHGFLVLAGHASEGTIAWSSGRFAFDAVVRAAIAPTARSGTLLP